MCGQCPGAETIRKQVEEALSPCPDRSWLALSDVRRGGADRPGAPVLSVRPSPDDSARSDGSDGPVRCPFVKGCSPPVFSRRGLLQSLELSGLSLAPVAPGALRAPLSGLGSPASSHQGVHKDCLRLGAHGYRQGGTRRAARQKLEVPARLSDVLWTRNAPSVSRQSACPCKACQADRLCRGTGQQVFVQETDQAVGKTCRNGVLGRRAGRAPAGHRYQVKSGTGQETARRTTLEVGQKTALANRTCTPCACQSLQDFACEGCAGRRHAPRVCRRVGGRSWPWLWETS